MREADGHVGPAHGDVIIGIDQVSAKVADIDDAHRVRPGTVIGQVRLHPFLIEVRHLEDGQDRLVIRTRHAVEGNQADGGSGFVLRDHGTAVVAAGEVPVLDRPRDIPGDSGMGRCAHVCWKDSLAVCYDAAVLPLQAVPGDRADVHAFRKRMQVGGDRAQMGRTVCTVGFDDKGDAGIDHGIRL